MRAPRIKDNLKFFTCGVILSALVAILAFEILHHPKVKRSLQGFCHTVGSPYYAQTFNFKPFRRLDTCIQSGGVEPKRL